MPMCHAGDVMFASSLPHRAADSAKLHVLVKLEMCWSSWRCVGQVGDVLVKGAEGLELIL